MSPKPIYLRVPEAAAVTGLPEHLLRKSFIRADKRPKNVPPPPPHKKLGRSVLIIAAELSGWAATVGSPVVVETPPAKGGRPSKAEQIARRKRNGEG
jgi:hypothetical protein